VSARGSFPLLLSCALVAATSALAQDGRPRAGQRREELQLRREEAFKMVDAYLVSNLQESLSLTDEQFTKVLPLVRKLQNERREYFLSRGRLMRELRQLLHGGHASESAVVERLTELKTLEDTGPSHIQQDLGALDAVLTPLQQAKYRVLEGDVEQRIRALVRERPPAPGRRLRE
jgi:Spy/CpxP family protein refolding chaperone